MSFQISTAPPLSFGSFTKSSRDDAPWRVLLWSECLHDGWWQNGTRGRTCSKTNYFKPWIIKKSALSILREGTTGKVVERMYHRLLSQNLPSRRIIIIVIMMCIRAAPCMLQVTRKLRSLLKIISKKCHSLYVTMKINRMQDYNLNSTFERKFGNNAGDVQHRLQVQEYRAGSAWSQCELLSQLVSCARTLNRGVW